MEQIAILLVSYILTGVVVQIIFSHCIMTKQMKMTVAKRIDQKKRTIIRILFFLVNAGIVLFVPDKYYLTTGVLLGSMCGLVVPLTDDYSK